MGGINLEWTGSAEGGSLQHYPLDIRMSEELASNDPTNHSILYPMRTGNKYQMTWTPVGSNGSFGSNQSDDGSTSSFEQHEYYLFRYGELKLLTPSPTTPPTPSPYQSTTCSHVPPAKNEDQKAGFGCQTAGEVITNVTFSSYGTPTGECNKDGTNSFKVATRLCHSQHISHAQHTRSTGSYRSLHMPVLTNTR
jgi:hypothetical protein